MHRFFVEPDALRGTDVVFAAEVAHQLRRVLRLAPGASVLVLDGSGRQWEVVLTSLAADGARGEIVREVAAAGEASTRITLFQGTLKGEKFEWVLQKGTELGVSRFVPLVTQRSVAADRAALAKKRTRWQAIIREAAEQAGRSRLPELAGAQDLAAACRDVGQPTDLRLLLWENERERSMSRALQGLAPCGGPGVVVDLFVGPEGGFADAEVADARANGLAVAGLGPRILRAETAGLVACAIVLYACGDFSV